MMPDINPPSEADLARMLDAHAHRRPLQARVPVVGDHGAEIALPVLLGLPSGACPTPAGARAASIWRDLVRASLYASEDAGAVRDRLVADCLLWPPAPTFSAWCNRWPALASDVSFAVMRKCGLLSNALLEPHDHAAPPKAIADALAADARAVWRRLAPPGAVYDIAIAAPDLLRYQVFVDAVRDGEAPAETLAVDFAKAMTRALVEGDKSVEPDDVFARYPGLAVQVAKQARRLGGAVREVQFGKW